MTCFNIRSIPIAHYILTVSEIVNPEHIAAVSRMISNGVLYSCLPLNGLKTILPMV